MIPWELDVQTFMMIALELDSIANCMKKTIANNVMHEPVTRLYASTMSASRSVLPEMLVCATYLQMVQPHRSTPDVRSMLGSPFTVSAVKSRMRWMILGS
jgi:hypothetical protein